MKYEIEDNIPLPVGWRVKYPLKELKVGQSFFVDADGVKVVISAVSYHNRRNPGTRFVTRAEGTGRRVWRTA